LDPRLKRAGWPVMARTVIAAARQLGSDRGYTGHVSDIIDTTVLSSGPEDFHLRALPEPYVNLSIHTAPVVRPFP
jgi:hypothetical protein